MPSSWRAYGVDANGDGVKDPYNPVDAIFAAARYLKAAGADTDIRGAVFAYNHANWYVDSVLLRAQVIGGLPSNLVGSLTGLTQGRFPVHAKATYAGQVKRGRKVEQGNAALVVESAERRNIKIFSRAGAPVVAVNDGRIVRTGVSERLGRYVMLQDVYGNTYTYGHLDRVAKRYPAPKEEPVTPEDLELPTRDGAPAAPASETDRAARREPAKKLADKAAPERPQGRRGAGRDEAAPVRAPGAAERGRRRRRPAGVRAHRPDRGRDLRRLPQPHLRPRPRGGRAQAPAQGRADRRRHRARPHRRRRPRRAARAVRDPAGRPRRPADRPEADPRRLEAARVDRDLPRAAARTRSSAPTPPPRRSARSC